MIISDIIEVDNIIVGTNYKRLIMCHIFRSADSINIKVDAIQIFTMENNTRIYYTFIFHDVTLSCYLINFESL